MHEVLVNRLGGLSLPRKSVVRLTDRPDMTLDVYRGRKTTIQPTNPGRGRKKRNDRGEKNVQTTSTRTCCKRSRPLLYYNLTVLICYIAITLPLAQDAKSNSKKPVMIIKCDEQRHAICYLSHAPGSIQLIENIRNCLTALSIKSIKTSVLY